MTPVLLLYVSIVILLIRSGTGKGNWLRALLEVANQMPIEELVAIIAIESEKLKWQVLFNLFGRRNDACGAFVPNGAITGPARANISVSDAPE